MHTNEQYDVDDCVCMASRRCLSAVHDPDYDDWMHRLGAGGAGASDGTASGGNASGGNASGGATVASNSEHGHRCHSGGCSH